MGQFGGMIRRIPVFQQAAVCLTKFGPESGETAKEILARKDLERRSGVGAHKNEFWWGVGERGTAQAIQTLISQHGGNIVLFAAIKDQKPPNKGSATDALVWRKYRMLGGDILQDIPKHVLITSAAVTKGGTTRTKHFALVCSSRVPLKIGGVPSDSPILITKISAKTASSESLQEANELPQHWSGGRAPRSRERSAIALLISPRTFTRPIVLNCSILCEYHLLQ